MQIIAVLAWTAAADVGAEDMLALYKEALGSDAQFQAAQSQYESILERVPQSRAALLPALTLDGNTISNNNSSNTFGSQNYNSHGYSVRLTQPLFRWDAKIARDQTLTLVQQAEAELALARQDLILRVSQAYFGVLLAEDALKALQTEKTAVGEEMAAAQRRFEIGTANITDVRDAKSRHDLVTAQEIAAQNELAAKREEIRRITRRQPSSIAPLRGGIQLAGPAPADIDSGARNRATRNAEGAWWSLPPGRFDRECRGKQVGHHQYRRYRSQRLERGCAVLGASVFERCDTGAAARNSAPAR
jgi:outer membrane protein